MTERAVVETKNLERYGFDPLHDIRGRLRRRDGRAVRRWPLDIRMTA